MPPRSYREGTGTGALAGAAFMSAVAGVWIVMAFLVAALAVALCVDRSRNWYRSE